MMVLEPFERLVKVLGRLPGVGKRSAERMARRLLRSSGGLLKELVLALQEADRALGSCSRCGSLTARAEDPCRLCTDPRRDDAILCVVEDPADIALLESAGLFRGRYHALMGRLSPQRGEGVNDLRIESLLKRAREPGVKEVILATNPDVEGDATASFLREALAPAGVIVTRLGLGIPAGSGIAYADAATLSRALEGRRRI